MPIEGTANPGVGPRRSEFMTPQPAMQRTINGPLRPSALAAAREAEKLRQEYDKWYITKAEASAIPLSAMTPEVMSRIQYSQRDWPENRMALSDALGPLDPGEGESYTQFGGHAAELFWQPEPGAPAPEHQMPGRRGIDRGER